MATSNNIVNEIVEVNIIPLGNSHAETNRNIAQLELWLQRRKKALSGRGKFNPKLIPSQMPDEGSLNIRSEILVSLAPKLLEELIKALKRFIGVQQSVVVFQLKIEQKKDNRIVTLTYNKDKLQNETQVVAELLRHLSD